MKLSVQGWQGAAARSLGLKSRTEFVSYTELAAFDEFVGQIEPELRRFVARKVRGEAVDDVLQEIWLAAWQALPTYDRRARLRTWIYGICVHKCFDHYRSQRREKVIVPLPDEPLSDPHPSPEAVAVQADTVRRLLASLDEDVRVVLELYYYAQLTLVEIASTLNRNLSTVKYQFYRAHATMLAEGEREELR